MKQILFLLAAVLLLGGCAEEKKTDVRWATFNIRYDNPQDSLNNWQYRKDRVCQFIKDLSLIHISEPTDGLLSRMPSSA